MGLAEDTQSTREANSCAYIKALSSGVVLFVSPQLRVGAKGREIECR
jgi:hypothetical protein